MTGFDCDVVVLGAGLAGTVLAAVLARNGARVQLVDAAQHPRFAIGESTIPHTATLFRLVGERYGVPEIKWLASFDTVRARIGATHGIKRGFNFQYHRAGRAHDPDESHQLPIPKIMHTEAHFYRQDLDAWLLSVAVRHGARVCQGTRVDGVEIGDDGVVVSAGEKRWRARFVVDAGGYRSPLAEQLGLRETPCRFRHHSRSMFTHLLDVRPWEEVAERDGPTAASRSTLHHVFEGGWIWVIPFDNHPRSFNRLVSVGMTLDPRAHPPTGAAPADEFAAMVDRFPAVRRQFATARPIREWTATGRLQYSSTKTVGARWALAMHAAGFLDPLFSRGLSFTMDWVHGFAHRLLSALADDDFTEERFAPVDQLTQGLLDYNDGLVANAYTSFASYPMWDAWIRVWALGEQLALFETNRAYGRFRATGDPAVLDRLESVAPHGSLPADPTVRAWFTWAHHHAARAGRDLPHAQVAADLLSSMSTLDFSPPAFGITDPATRHFHAKPHQLPSLLRWSRNPSTGELGHNLAEALSLYTRIRAHPGEYAVAEELKHYLATGLQALTGKRRR